MNRNDFLNMIESAVPVNRQMISEVYELIDIFPYFQSAHMLLLKGLQNNTDIKFENQLRNSAIHIADREVLYHFLQNNLNDKVEHVEHLIDKDLSEEKYVNTEQTVIELAKNSQILIQGIERDATDASMKEDQSIDSDSHSHSILVSSESENEISEGVMILLDDEPSAVENQFFYMDPGISVPGKNDLLELDIDENKSNTIDDSEKSLTQFDLKDQISNKLIQSELIDKFIITNPRIEPNRNKIDLPVEDISKPFTEENGGLVTETLARIFINQGYYSKAIDIYEKLSLKFPEKSSYFASQIEKVKEYINK